MPVRLLEAAPPPPTTPPRRRWLAAGVAAVSIAAAGLVGAALNAPVHAAAGPVDTRAEDAPRSSSYPPLSTTLVPCDAGTGIETATKSRPVAPGVTLTSFDRFDPNGWLRADALSTDLGAGPTVDYLYSGAVSRPEPLSGPAGRTRAVAAVNGDFFDINNSGAAQGIGLQRGALVQSPVSDHNNAVGVTADGVGRVLQVYFEGTATLPTATVPLTQFNQLIQPSGVGVFTPLWGAYTRARAIEGASRVLEVVIVGGVVTETRTSAGSGEISAGTTILLGRDEGADALAILQPGDPVSVAYRPRTSDGSTLHAAVGGSYVLVRDGVPQAITDASLAPRTAVGFTADGRRMILLTVDGRQVDSRGATLSELGRMMAELGAHHALNLDGGGSSTLLAREPGTADVQVENSPSDGFERPVPNGLAIYAPAGSGKLKGFWVETASDPTAAPGVSPVRGGRPDRVFPGLTRKLTAAGYDETYGPAAGAPQWTVSAPHTGVVNGNGVFRAILPGSTTVTATRGSHHGAARGQLQLTVLGPLRAVDATSDLIGLRDTTTTGTFGMVGFDAERNSAPIEPSDLTLEYDTALLEVTPTVHGYFTVRARQASGAGLVTVRVGEHSTSVPVTVGLTEQPVASFDDASTWTFSAARATGSVSPVAGRTGTGLQLTYDFTQSTATRAAYANPPVQVAIPGQPQAFGMWIQGSGHGEWPSLHLVDALGQDQVLRGPHVTWTGWQYVEFAVPAGVAYPLRLRRFYVAETRATTQYQGRIVIDDLTAKVPPPVDRPAEPRIRDRVVVTDGTVDGAPWRFAVVSDAQFVAREPDSPIVQAARRSLREVKAARPDFLLINGDWVDEGSPADLAFAKRILDEELGGELPYVYVPGNHEVMGGVIDNFTAVFGAPFRTFDHKGTRFVTLDTSRLTVRGGGFDQVRLLRDALAGAATDPAIGSVVLVEHVPPRDPSPAKASQLNDRKEAALLEQWLSEFQHSTGKGALLIGAHVGTFHAARVDGVPCFINGNAGKTPSTAADDGGFAGWSMVGVDPVTPAEAAHARRNPLVEGPRWVDIETRARVDTLTVAVPSTLDAGKTGTVTATLVQGGRQVPVAHPVSADWSGGENVHIGPWFGVRPWHTAWLDPGTGTLTALRPGTATITVTVNGVKATADVAVR